MLQDAHSRKIPKPVSAPVGDTVIILAEAVTGSFDHWTYLHELIGDLNATGTISVVAINQSAAERILATFNLDAGQGLTEQDEPGEDNRPRFEFFPGEDVVLRVTGGDFIGAMDYSIRQ